jgi:plasmid maintenance system antidote protein VapI
MNNYEEIYKKLREIYTDEEIAEGYMIPETLTKEEQKISDEEFRKLRFALLNNRTEKQRILSEVTRLRIQIKQYLEEEIYSPLFDFGKILEEYITILKRSRKEFAEDIDIHYTKLSRIINSREEPNISLIYRLVRHSSDLIPVTYWWKLMTRKQEDQLLKDVDLMEKEGKRVKNKLELAS